MRGATLLGLPYPQVAAVRIILGNGARSASGKIVHGTVNCLKGYP